MKLTEMISTCCDAWIESADQNGHGACSECGENSTPVTVQMALNEIFSQSPLPNRLKTPKQRWIKGELRETAICTIIREYSDYNPFIGISK